METNKTHILQKNYTVENTFPEGRFTILQQTHLSSTISNLLSLFEKENYKTKAA